MHPANRSLLAAWACALAMALAITACGPLPEDRKTDDPAAGAAEDGACPEALPYATEIVHFRPGPNAGFGQDAMPDIVLGPPAKGPPSAGSLDVLSLGVAGEIVLGFGGRDIVDSDGPDLIVWENPFWVGGDPDKPFAELGAVAVSQDGESWHEFPCDPTVEDGFDPGCAGWRPRYEYEACDEVPLSPDVVAGDPFDLADLGLDRARFVRIRDLSAAGAAPSAGFDLDAVGAVRLTP